MKLQKLPTAPPADPRVIEQRLRDFISAEFMSGQPPDFDRNGSLLQSGIIDSIGLFRLVFFLQDAFRLPVPSEDISTENFQTLADIVRYVEQRVRD